MASVDRTFFLNDMTFHDDSWDAAVQNNNNDVTFHNYNGGEGMPPPQPPNMAPMDLTFLDLKTDTSFLDSAPTASLQTPKGHEMGGCEGKLETMKKALGQTPCRSTAKTTRTPPPRTPSETPMPRTPMPHSGAKRKIPEEASKRLRLDDSMNTSNDIDAMIHHMRIDMERDDAVHQEKLTTLESLIPIVCDASGNRYPEAVKLAALEALADLLAMHTSLVERLVLEKPNILKHMNDIAGKHENNEKVFTAVFRILSSVVQNCFK